MSRPGVAAPLTSSTVEDAMVRCAKARAQALESVTAARQMVTALRLLRQEVPGPARDAAHEIRKATRALDEELDRELAR
jgi:hypothetical protein